MSYDGLSSSWMWRGSQWKIFYVTVNNSPGVKSFIFERFVCVLHAIESAPNPVDPVSE